MKIYLIFVILGIFFNSLLADSIISEDDIIANIPLKDNQVLLFDSRSQKAIGILEVTPSGKILKIPLPKNLKNNNSTQNNSSPTPNTSPIPATPSSSNPSTTSNPSIPTSNTQEKNKDTKDISTPQLQRQESLINKNKQWDKKKIPYLIKEEVIPTE